MRRSWLRNPESSHDSSFWDQAPTQELPKESASESFFFFWTIPTLEIWMSLEVQMERSCERGEIVHHLAVLV